MNKIHELFQNVNLAGKKIFLMYPAQLCHFSVAISSIINRKPSCILGAISTNHPEKSPKKGHVLYRPLLDMCNTGEASKGNGNAAKVKQVCNLWSTLVDECRTNLLSVTIYEFLSTRPSIKFHFLPTLDVTLWSQSLQRNRPPYDDIIPHWLITASTCR